MDTAAVLTLIGASALLVAIPGPNVALIIANTMAHGLRFGVATVFGTTIGVALQLAVVVFGLAVLLELASTVFIWLKWAGVAYLLYLGITSWRQGIDELQDASATQRPLRTVFWQGILLAIVNPKTLLFNAAFLPQFVSAQSGPASLMLAAGLYLTVILLGDLVWAISAESAKPAIAKLGRLRHKLTGCLFFGSGIGLALARGEK